MPGGGAGARLRSEAGASAGRSAAHGCDRGRRGGPGRAQAAGARGRAGAAPGPGAGARSLGAAGARTDRPLPRRLGRLFPTPTLLLRAPCRSPFHLPPAPLTCHPPPPLPSPVRPRPPRGRLPKSGGSERARLGEGGDGRAEKAAGLGALRGPPSRCPARTAWRLPPGAGRLAVCKWRAQLRGPACVDPKAGLGVGRVVRGCGKWGVECEVVTAVVDGTRRPGEFRCEWMQKCLLVCAEWVAVDLRGGGIEPVQVGALARCVWV